LKFLATYANPVYDNGGATNEIKAVTHALRAGSLLPAVYLDPTLGGQSFFSRIEVLINGEKIAPSYLEEFNYIYQSANRSLTTDDFCRKKYGKKLSGISTSAQRLAGTVATMDPSLKDAARSLTFRRYDSETPNLTRFSFDGNFPFSSQSNVLQSLLQMKNENGFLLPMTTIEVRLHKRQPLTSMIESCRMLDSVYFSDGDPPNNQVTPDIAIKMTDLTIVYESFTPDPRELDDLTKPPINYYVDVPQFTMFSVPAGQKRVDQICEIPARSRVVLIGWAHTNQLWHESSSNKNLHARFRFIPGAINIKLKATGKEGLLFSEGLENIGVPEASSSNWAQAYHGMLTEKELTDESFERLFPFDSTVVPYKQLLVLDLTDYVFPDNFQLTATTLFDAQMSPKGYYMFCISLQQYLYVQDSDFKFKHVLLD
jgi:hypothetical protein